MGEHGSDATELADFVAARTAELHRTAYLLAADQDRAEQLVEIAVAGLARHPTDVGQAGALARRCMARLATTGTTPTVTEPVTDDTESTIAHLSPRERAVLMLRSLDGLDVTSTARELGMSRSSVATAEQSACTTVGFEPLDDRLREALSEFADRATWPDADATLARAAAVRPPRRLPRKRYLAAAVVLAVTAAAPIGSQVHHNQWLRTPAGINASHGTHFHAFTQGYQLADVQRIAAGGSRDIDLSPGDVIVLSCDSFSPRKQSSWPWVDSADSQGPWACAKQSAERYFFAWIGDGQASVKAPHTGHEPVIVGVYRPVAWSKYPVARADFQVEHDKTLESVQQQWTPGTSPISSGRTLVMEGGNGSYTASIQLPANVKGTVLALSGLFSPTSTGQYKVTVAGDTPMTCSTEPSDQWCRLYDHYVPQIPIGSISADNGQPSSGSGSEGEKVRVDVRDAVRPWRLELRYDRYRSDN